MKNLSKKNVALVVCASVALIGIVAAIIIGLNLGKTVYTVTFDSQGGAPIQSQEVKEGDKVSKPEDPFKVGFTFVEWQYNHTTYDFNSEVTQDMELVAYYTINEGTQTITVAFNYNDDDVGVKNISIAKGTPIGEPNAPTREGYIFEGWFLGDEKFDFSIPIDENIVLTGKWTEDPDYNPSDKDKDKNGSGSNNKEDGANTNGTGSKPGTGANKISFKDVEGIWYVEGTDDATLEFILVDGKWVSVISKNFDYYTGVVKKGAGHVGTEYFYDGEHFYADEIRVDGDKLIYTKNNSTVILYREKDYPSPKLWPDEELLKEIDGYYWYLDGYDNTYLHPTITDSNGDKALTWDSENIEVHNGKVTVYEDYGYEEYNKIDSNASTNTNNSLGVNPLDDANSLVDDYKMKVDGDKLYITVGDKTYIFTKHEDEKPVEVSLSITGKAIVKTTGERIEVPVKVSPFWSKHKLISISSNPDVVQVGRQNVTSTDGNVVMDFTAGQVGTATITIKDVITQASTTVTVTVNPVKVTGVSLNKSTLTLEKGSNETLSATVLPDNAANKKVVWHSSNEAVATVSSSGKVTAVGKGTATITVKTEDGAYTAACTVTVVYPKLTVKASVGTGTWTSEDTTVQGVFGKALPTGGSGVYEAYYVKLYYNGELVGEGARDEVIVTPIRSGTYYAEVYVRDSEGTEVTATATKTIS